MLYKGRIDNLQKLVVSDPSYGEDVWCRYESTNFPPGKKWAAQLQVNEYNRKLDGFTLSGVEFSLMLCTAALEKNCRFSDDMGFICPMALDVGEPTEIGMDTACVALGINARADLIKAEQGSWQPDCALKTLTDGFFGDVFEGKYEGLVWLVVVSGALDDDTGYTVQDVVDYLRDAFEIKDLELVQEKAAVNERIAEAMAEKNDKEGSFEERLKDAYDRSAHTGSNGNRGSGSDDGPGEVGEGKEKANERKPVSGDFERD